jgi:hypothetical protein
MPQARDDRRVKIGRDAPTLAKLSQGQEFLRDLVAKGGIGDDHHHAAKARTNQEREGLHIL